MMIEAHGQGHSAILLARRQVLVAGGFKDSVQAGRGRALRSLPPVRGPPPEARWRKHARGRLSHTATLLPDGTVLVVGSVSSSASVYDRRADPHGIDDPRHFTATLLPDGRVLVTCYEGSKHCRALRLATGTWTETGSRSRGTPRDLHGDFVTRRHGPGRGGDPNNQLVELYHPRSGTWAVAPNTRDARQGPIRRRSCRTERCSLAGGRGGFWPRPNSMIRAPRPTASSADTRSPLVSTRSTPGHRA